MPLSTYQEVLDQAKDHMLIAVLYLNGEPLMYKDLVPALKYATDRKVATLIATNGELLYENKIIELLDSGLDVIKIAITGFTQEIYQVQQEGLHLEDMMVMQLQLLITLIIIFLVLMVVHMILEISPKQVMLMVDIVIIEEEYFRWDIHHIAEI